MPAPFAAMESRVNAAALAALANATATIGGVEIDGVFRNSYGEALGMIGGTDPTFTCESSKISGLVEGGTVIINAVTYIASSDPEPDGTGISTVRLRK